MKLKRRLPKFTSEAKKHRAKLYALLQAGYAELGSEARRLEREFARLEADPVLKAVWKNERDAAYDRL